MSNWEVFKAILKATSFYKTKFAIFAVIAAAIGIFGGWRSHLKTEAQYQYSGPMTEAYSSQAQADIVIKENGDVLIDGVQHNDKLSYFGPYDEFRLLVYDQPREFLSYFRGTIHLPSEVAQKDITQITYAVHGVGGYINYMPDGRTLVYEVSDISPGATVTIVARLPKGLIHPPFFTRVKFIFSQLGVKAWSYIAIILPAITLIVMTFMFIRRRSSKLFLVKEALGSPPENISPALSGVLVDGTVGAREIAATLIDLAERGYIFIVNKGAEGFTFGKRKFNDPATAQGLSDFEKALLSKIFTPEAIKSTVADVETRIGRHIFSRKIASFYLDLYNQATLQGYFVKNPTRVHLTYKYTGVGLFFLSFIGFMIGAITGADPKFILLFWAGGMVAASLIIKFAPYMPARTPKGEAEVKKWLSFREYLASREPIPAGDLLQDRFEKYLPYAVVLGSEVDWAKRFIGEPFHQPEWYDSPERIVTLESFVNNFYPFIGYVSDNLAKSHDPIVE